jgi:hypothetical protein
VKPSMFGGVRTETCDDAVGQQASIEVDVGVNEPDDVGDDGLWSMLVCWSRH